MFKYTSSRNQTFPTKATKEVVYEHSSGYRAFRRWVRHCAVPFACDMRQGESPAKCLHDDLAIPTVRPRRLK